MNSRNLSKLFILSLVFLLPISTVSAQNADLKAIEKKAEHFIMSNYDSSFYYFVILDSLAELSNDTTYMLSAKNFLIYHYYVKQNSLKSVEYCDVLASLTNEPSELLSIYNQCGASYQSINVTKTDSFFLLALEVAKKYNIRTPKVASIHINYASFLILKGDYGNSILHFQDAFQYEMAPIVKINALKSMTYNYLNTNNVSRAKESILEAVAIAEANNYKSRNGHLAWMMSKVAAKENNIKIALEEIDRAIIYFKDDRKTNYVQVLIQKANLFIKQKDWESAEEQYNLMKPHLEKMVRLKKSPLLVLESRLANHNKEYHLALQKSEELLQILEKVDDETNKLNAFGNMVASYTGLEQYENAFDYLSKKEQLANSIFRTSQARLVTQLEAEYKRKEQNQEIDFLGKENYSKSLVVVSQKKTLYIGSVALGLISLLSFFMFRLYNKVNGQKKVISKALSEKDILLREIHHRVKNNLQLVSSLLTLQGKSISDQTALDAINEGRSRVRSMALIHQDLYNKENLTGISVKKYLEKLTKELFYTYNIDEDNISLNLNIENLELDVDTLVPLGLIINELITNSLKYAFPEGQKGVLNVSIKEINSKLVLNISDNGVGYDISEVGDNSFGSTLITALTEQLEGTMKINTIKGTAIEIQFENFEGL